MSATTQDEVSAQSRTVASLFIDGSFVESETGARAESVSPANGATLGSYCLASAVDADRAVLAARKAAPGWAAWSPHERIRLLARVRDLVVERADRLSRLLALEQGKPLHTEARDEVAGVVAAIDSAAENVKRLDGLMPPSVDRAKRLLVYRVPRGVAVLIQPWNFPISIAAGQVAPAIASGNTVVTLPAPSTSLVAHELAACFAEAEFPAGVFNFLTGRGDVVGGALTSHPSVAAVSFTGSTVTGAVVARSAAGKAQVLELGGNGPTVILEDADLERAVPAALWSAFLNAGQSCTAGERFLVHERVLEEFAERAVAATRATVRLGDPLSPATTMGPLNNAPTAAKVDRHVAEALHAGATALTGGARSAGSPTELYWEPTVLTGVTAGMALATEESFGPVLPIEAITSDDEALARIDQSPFGLAAAVFTQDLARGLRFAERASTGTVNINESSVWTEASVPFGGGTGKGSGIGRGHARFAMEELFTELKTVVVHLG